MHIIEKVERPGDMHPTRGLKIYVDSQGDVLVVMTQDGIAMGGIDTGGPNECAAKVEFCASGGRSPRTRAALMELVEAMKADNEQHPIR